MSVDTKSKTELPNTKGCVPERKSKKDEENKEYNDQSQECMICLDFFVFNKIITTFHKIKWSNNWSQKFGYNLNENEWPTILNCKFCDKHSLYCYCFEILQDNICNKAFCD